jgi:hypothetical protein
MTTPRSWRGQTGSMVLVLLVAIVIGGIVVALVATTLSGQRKVQHDRNFQLAINGAEAGVAQAMNVITSLPEGDDTTYLGSDDLALNTALGDDIDFVWEAERGTVISWNITATGTRNGVSRTVEVLAVRNAMFFVAAFADLGFTMIGANEADSYNADSWDNGLGGVGSNGQLNMEGNAVADLIFLMGELAACSGEGCTSGEMAGLPDAFDLDAVADLIETAHQERCDSWSPYVFGSTELVGGETYCFTDFTIPNGSEGNQNEVLLTNASSSNPVTVYLSGDFKLGRHSRLNCDPECSPTGRPDSGALQVYSTGDKVELGNQSKLAIAMAAPTANCVGNPSNAQVDIYGAIVCRDIGNNGGWKFHFDERLLGIGSGTYEIREWREEVGGSTTFATN